MQIENLKQTHNLRLLFWGFIVFLILSAAFAGDEIFKNDWRIFPSLIVPSLVPAMFFLIPLDITMCAVQRASTDQQDKKHLHYSFCIKTDIILMVILALCWLPFVLKLGA